MKKCPSFTSQELYDAASTNRVEYINLAIENGIDINIKTPHGRTMLHGACEHGKAEIVRKLIKAGANINERTRHQETPLHLAYNLEIVQELLKAGADVTAQNNAGRTPLHLACMIHQLDVARELILSGANPQVTDINDLTPLDYLGVMRIDVMNEVAQMRENDSRKKRHIEMIKKLLSESRCDSNSYFSTMPLELVDHVQKFAPSLELPSPKNFVEKIFSYFWSS